MGLCGQDSCGSCGSCGTHGTAGRRPAAVLAAPFAQAAGQEGVALAPLLHQVRSMLAEAGVPSPEADAASLSGHVLGLPRNRLHTVPELTPAAADAVLAAARRRAEREPLQHIVGEAGFRYLDLNVGPGVFVPRPETEVVVDAVLGSLPASGTAVVVDLGAGSGAISLAVATERPDTTVYAVELDAAAVPWLTQNVMRHAQLLRDQNSKIIIVMGDAGAVAREDQPLWRLTGSVDLVVSNPPYIPDDQVPRDQEVRDYDPPLALYGGPDGLDVVRRWLDTAAELLRPGGLLVLEHGDVQGDDRGVPGLLARHEDIVAAGPVWRGVSDHLDLAGRSRFSMARRTDG